MDRDCFTFGAVTNSFPTHSRLMFISKFTGILMFLTKKYHMTLGPDGWVYTLGWVFCVCKHVILKGFCLEWLFVWKSGFFFVSFENFALIRRSHHFRRSAVECFCSHNHWAVKVLYRGISTPTEIRSSPRISDIDIRAFCSGAVATYLDDLGLSPPELEHIPSDTCDTCTWTPLPIQNVHRRI